MTNKNILLNIFIISILFTFTIEIDSESIKAYFRSFLQKKVPNRVIMAAITAIRELESETYPDHLEYNIEHFPRHLPQIQRYNGFIEDQSNYYDLKYGHQTIDFSGCEVIAVYNALYALTGDKNIDFPAVILQFCQFFLHEVDVSKETSGRLCCNLIS